MNPLDSAIMQYATGWQDAIALRVLIGLTGGVVVAGVLRTLVRRHFSLIAVLLCTLAGGGLLAFSMAPQMIIDAVIQTEYMLRIRLLMGGISVFVLLITFESLRRTHMQERYALLWITTAMTILCSVYFPQTVALFRAVTGMEYGSAMASVAFTFLALVAFHFSISFSAFQTKQARLAQRLAILEARLRALEEKEKPPGIPPVPGSKV